MDNVVFIVAHPDDMAYGMGGTAWLMKDHYNLHVLCATKGEKGLRGTSEKETARIREVEEQQASGELLGAQVTFLDRIDREVFADQVTAAKVAELLLELKPVAVFTLWPIDSHPDHSAVSELTKKALFLSEYECELLFCEEGLGCQTTQFDPDIYVDISSVMEEKLAMIRCHVCQNPDDKLAQRGIEQFGFRGMQNNVEFAEGFKTIWPAGVNRKKSILETLP